MFRFTSLPTIFFINILVFGLWHLLPARFMTDHFLVSWTALEQGRFWVLLTSVFSHNMLLHFLINMIVLQNFGGMMERFLGTKRFISFFIIAGLISSLCHASFSNFFMDAPGLPALGASGSLAGLILLFSLLFPKERLLFFGIIPIPAIFGAFAFIGLDIWGLIAQAQGGGLPIGHGAHLGGAFTGLIYYIYLKNKSSFSSSTLF